MTPRSGLSEPAWLRWTLIGITVLFLGKPLPDPIPLKIQFPINPSRIRSP